MGLIDWLTISIDASLLSLEDRQTINDATGKIIGVDKEGNVEWVKDQRETVKSDSHQICVSFGSFLSLYGSPARVTSHNNVFGSLDICQCATNMILFVNSNFDLHLPLDFSLWKCTRIDVTRNYDLGSQSQAEYYVHCHKLIKLGNQKTVTFQHMVSYGGSSRLHSGKIYVKGHDLKRLVKRSKAKATDTEILKSMQIVRLEYSIRNKMMNQFTQNGLNWYEMSSQFLLGLHESYFAKYINDLTVEDTHMGVLNELMACVESGLIPTEGQAKAAYDCYHRIRNLGYTMARTSYTSSSTWYRHLKHLEHAGYSKAMLQKVINMPTRYRRIELANPVSCWDDINLAC